MMAMPNVVMKASAYVSAVAISSSTEDAHRDHRHPGHPAGARERQPGHRLAAVRSSASGEHGDDEDDEERHGLGEAGERRVAHAQVAGDVGLEQRDLALEDADDEGRGDGDGERREPPDQGGGQRREDGEGQDRCVQGDDRREQDGRQRRQEPGDHVVDELDARRRPTSGGRHSAVLGHRRGRQPEQRAAVDEAEHDREEQRQPDQHEAVLADAKVTAQGDRARREQRFRLTQLIAPDERHRAPGDAQQRERGDEPAEQRRLPEEGHDRVGHEPEQGADAESGHKAATGGQPCSSRNE